MRGLHPVPLLVLYVGIAFAPLALAAALGLPPRPLRDDLSSGLAMVALAMLLLEFVLSGRFHLVSGRVGIDLTMRLHQLLSRSLLAFILVHPVLYQTRLMVPQGAPGLDGLGLTGMSLLSGGFGLLLLVALVIVALIRDRSGDTYEGWRIMHGAVAIAAAILGVHHTLDAGRYAAHPVLAAYWLALLALALFTYGYVHVITPLRQRRHPYRVVSVRKVALKTWDLLIEPVAGPAMEFTAGQFVWLTLGRSPFAITEHPFSISSSPVDRPRIGFTIKEAGDFTNRIGSIPAGTPAYLDGPHGTFTLAGRKGTGIAFIAGGVGMAPIMGILRQLRAADDRRPMVLVYGNRVEDQILYAAELAGLQATMDIAIHHVLSEPPTGWSGAVGQIDDGLLRRVLAAPNRSDWLYFVCGPAPMIEAAEGALGRLGVPLRQIVSEKFRYD